MALRRDSAVASEAAMKYFVLGAMASGFLLYGLSMMYGATGSLDINEVFKAIASQKVNHQVLVFGLVFIVAGLAFKVGAAPFHMWVPDVYQGAPTSVTLMIGAAPELAAFAIIIRLLVEGLLPLAFDWQQMLALLAIASLLVGNLAAIAQTNLKRMLAYSTIAQMGFMLLGLVAGRGQRQHLQRPVRVQRGDVLHRDLRADHAGQLRHHPAPGARRLRERGDHRPGRPQPAQPALCRRDGDRHVLAGRRAAAGRLLRQARGAAGADRSGQAMYIGLAVFAVLMSLIGSFYYLRVVKVMYFDAPVTASTVSAPQDVRTVLTLNGALILISASCRAA